MCLVKTCCCGCTLRQGAIGIMIYDGILTLLAFISAIIVTIIIDEFDSDQIIKSLVVTTYWIYFILPVMRFLPALISSCCDFKVSTRIGAFIFRVMSDAVYLLLLIIGIAFAYLDFVTIAIQMIFLGLEIYFNMIWYSFYK